MAVRFAPGSILRLSTSENNTAYAIMLESRPYMAIYRDDDIKAADHEILGEPIFIVAVHKSAYSRGGWGDVISRVSLQSLPPIPPVFRQDVLNPVDCVIDYSDGSHKRAKPADCVGLEPNAVWEADHIESRVDDFYAGRPNEYVESMKVKL